MSAKLSEKKTMARIRTRLKSVGDSAIAVSLRYEIRSGRTRTLVMFRDPRSKRTVEREFSNVMLRARHIFARHQSHKFTEPTEKRIVRFAATGRYSGNQLSEMFRCTQKNLYTVLHRYDIHLRKYRPPTKLTLKQELDVIRRVCGGESASAVARDFCFDHGNVRNIFKRHAIVYINPVKKHAAEIYWRPWQSMKGADKKKKLETMSLTEFQTLADDPEYQHCIYCKALVERTQSLRQGRSVAYLLDRRSNRFGHVLGNVVPACWSCNKTRNHKGYSVEEMIAASKNTGRQLEI